jgi:ADP-dependent NAD(P)H-hydrate dehydratase
VSRRVRDLDLDAVRAWPLPDPGGGKDARGRVVVVGGSRRTPGAVLLAAEAAVRAGAGKPQVATVASVAIAVSVALPEGSVTDLPETDDGEIAPSASGPVVDLAADCDALLLGPGLLSPAMACHLLEEVVPQLRCPVVVDALAMAYLTEHPEGMSHLAGSTILTPNESELAHTLRRDEDDVRGRLVDCAAELADRSGATVVVGGDESFVVTPGADAVWRHPGGVPGLGVAGSGDVKAGIVAGLLARGLPAEGAAVWGVALHQGAGRAASERSGPVGFLAREVLPQIPTTMARLSAHVG